ncbi:hypothetical protein N9B82_01020 [Saprospiraceae bacterium]|nr:hypothetical protein [Saprospiraceae bacterium]
MTTFSKAFLPLIALIFFSQLAFATVHRVNNTGADADFTTAQAAHDAALAGDTLYIESSTISYGALSISKEIHVIGSGYFLGQNTDLQANIAPSSIDNLTLNSGCNNSSIQGLTIITVVCGASSTFGDVVIERNNITSGIYLSTSQDITSLYILRNYVTGTNATLQLLRTLGTGLKTIVFSNNIAIYSSTSTRITLDQNTTATFKNNILDVYTLSSTFCIYKNNIINIASGSMDESNNTVEYNTCIGTDCSSNNNNTNNAVLNNLFVGIPTQGAFSSDSRYALTPSSAAAGAGEAGIDCGAFDGEAIYKLSGIPPIPSIYKLIAPSIVTGNFNITISTRSNN